MKTRTRLALALLLVVPALLAAGCGGDDVPVDAVAVIEGTPISTSELDALVARVRTSFRAQRRDFPRAGTPEFQVMRIQAVAYLVQRSLNDIEAGKRGIEITDTDVDARIEQLKQRFFAGDQARLDRQLTQQGYTLPAFRADVRAEIVSARLADQVTADLTVTEAEARAYYERNKTQYTTKPGNAGRYAAVAAQIKDQLRQTKRNTALASFATEVRDSYEGKVAYAAGYEPPDLTPPERQPPAGGHSGGGHGGNGNS